MRIFVFLWKHDDCRAAMFVSSQPAYLQDVQADVSMHIHVGVEARCDKFDGRRGARVVIGEGQGELVREPCEQQGDC